MPSYYILFLIFMVTVYKNQISIFKAHQNNCKSLIQCEDNDAHKLKVEELEQKHDTLMLKVILFEEKVICNSIFIDF
jgi:hypothetical protein